MSFKIVLILFFNLNGFALITGNPIAINNFLCRLNVEDGLNECYFESADPNITEENMEIRSVNWADGVERTSHSLIYRFSAISRIFSYFPTNFDQKFPKLVKIFIQHSGLLQIKQKDISPFIGLKELSLSYNNLTEIEAGLFDYNFNLEKVDLSNNKIYYVDVVSLQKLGKLKSFNLGKNFCSISPSAFNDIYTRKNVLDKIKAKCNTKTTTATITSTAKTWTQTKTSTEQPTVAPYEVLINQKIYQLNQDFNSKYSALEKENKNLQAKVSTLESNLNEVKKQKVTLENQLKQNSDELTINIFQKSKEIKTMREDFTSFQTDDKKYRKEMDDKLKKISEDMNAKQRKFELSFAERLKSSESKINVNISMISNDIKTIRTLNHKCQLSNTELREMIETINKDITEMKQDDAKLKRGLQTIEQGIEENLGITNSKLIQLNNEFSKLNETLEHQAYNARISSPLTDEKNHQGKLMMTNVFLIIVIVVFMIYSCIRCLFKRQQQRISETPYEMPKLKKNLTMTTLNYQSDVNNEDIYNEPNQIYHALKDLGYDKVKIDELYEELPSNNGVILNCASSTGGKLNDDVAYDEIMNDKNLLTEYEEIGFNIEKYEEEERVNINLPVYAIVNKNKDK